MRGRVASFRRGGNRYYGRQVIIVVQDAEGGFHRLVGRRVVWKHPKTGEVFSGRIVRLHGRRGRVIAYFKRQLPGEAVGSVVEIEE